MMLTDPKTQRKKLYLFSQFSLNGLEIIDPEHLPEDYAYVWVANAVRSDRNICEAMSELSAFFPKRQLSVMDISHLFSNEYASLIFFSNMEIFAEYAGRLYQEYQICLRRDNSNKITDYSKQELLENARQLQLRTTRPPAVGY